MMYLEKSPNPLLRLWVRTLWYCRAPHPRGLRYGTALRFGAGDPYHGYDSGRDERPQRESRGDFRRCFKNSLPRAGCTLRQEP